MRKPLIEPFADFASLDRGKPFLSISRSGRHAYVHWGDGSLRDCLKFPAVLDSAAMDAELLGVWERYKPQFGRKAEFADGGVHGGMIHVPSAAADEVHAIVRKHFTTVLAALTMKLVSEGKIAT